MTEPGRLLHPAGRTDNLAGDPSGIIGGEEDDHPGNVVRGHEATE
jgi:hypothetical protein